MNIRPIVAGATRRSLLKFVAAGVVAVPALAVASCSTDSDGVEEDSRADAPSGTLTERNTDVVNRALDEFYGQGNTDRFDDFFASDYVEHDPAIADGRDGVIAWVDQTRAQEPRVVGTIKRILAQGSMVAVHSHRSTTPEDEMTGTAVVELFDLLDGKIVEHWAYTQSVPATTRSGNSMFSDIYDYVEAPPTISVERADANKQLILKAWAAIYSARDFTVLGRYWALGDGYLQHNPNVPNGVGGLKGFLGTLPQSVSQNRFALGSGDLVVTVNQSVATSADLDSDAVGSSVVDIYRVADGRVVEHWDIVAPVPTLSANSNSVFSRLYRVA